MIERFNFYDVYGYLVPGGNAVILAALPAMLADRLDFAAVGTVLGAFVALLVAYVTGHLLQSLADAVIAGPWRDGRPSHRHPSDELFDPTNVELSVEAKKYLASAVRADFGLDLQSGDSARREAFRLCRQSLVARRLAGYAEQFQGMYALMRGLALGYGFAAFYALGVAIACGLSVSVRAGAALVPVSLIALVVGTWLLHRRGAGVAKVAVAGSAISGVYVGALLGVPRDCAFVFAGIAALCLLANSVCYRQFKKFQQLFAKSVFLDYSVWRRGAGDSPAGAGAPG